VYSAATQVRAKLLDIAASVLEASVDDLTVADGQVSVAGDPASAMPIAEVLWRSRTGSVTADGQVITDGGLDPETGQGVASDHWHQGAAGVEVEVDLGTGKVYVTHVYCIAFAGRVVNPKLARLQLEGSALFGISNALYEEMIFDNGQLTNPNLSDYSVISLGDVPIRFEVDTLEQEGEMRPHGLGETTLPPVIAALGNAVAAATGRRVRSHPLTPERVLGLTDEETDVE
jgi:CO/xanthine dehydrogenase Mo-binding subunit